MYNYLKMILQYFFILTSTSFIECLEKKKKASISSFDTQYRLHSSFYKSFNLKCTIYQREIMRKLMLCASQIKECTMYNICYAGETGFFK